MIAPEPDRGGSVADPGPMNPDTATGPLTTNTTTVDGATAGAPAGADLFTFGIAALAVLITIVAVALTRRRS